MTVDSSELLIPILCTTAGNESVPFAVNTATTVPVDADAEWVSAAILRISPPPDVVISPTRVVSPEPTAHAVCEMPMNILGDWPGMMTYWLLPGVVPAPPPGVVASYHRSTVNTVPVCEITFAYTSPPDAGVATTSDPMNCVVPHDAPESVSDVAEVAVAVPFAPATPEPMTTFHSLSREACVFVMLCPPQATPRSEPTDGYWRPALRRACGTCLPGRRGSRSGCRRRSARRAPRSRRCRTRPRSAPCAHAPRPS